MNRQEILKLNALIHAPIRLAILSVLISVEHANFTFLKENIGTTDGNLSTHLTKLEDAGYIHIKKIFVGKKPQTLCSITESGRNAFMDYLVQMEQIVQLKNGNS
jgi:DNA-binding transcriptional ArsR family regulator